MSANVERFMARVNALLPTSTALADAESSGLDNPNWRPYCLACSCMSRMVRVGDGWHCSPTHHDMLGRFGCGNTWTPTP